MKDVEFKIIEHIAILATLQGNWTKELNRVEWNGGDVKYDIRDWSPDHKKMGRGITLTDDEATLLKVALIERDDI